MTERKTQQVLGEDQCGFRRGNGTGDAIRMLRIISERTLEIDEELCACFKDWQMAYDHANWTILMQILKKLVFTGTKKKRLSANSM